MTKEVDTHEEFAFVSLDEMEPPPDCTWCGEPTYRAPDNSVQYRCDCWTGGE